ncbi:T9SS type A sorting domain-containing protein [Cytophagaceae bacterium SJW1-29]|uniref:T9SS type A sorting domain-containing protein n=2 Tax=Salmonirosea aquatica TaxID=2654236 RepID=A0A7C9FQM0_9BACT|nr:T9SS type A sorting domain-containing protein [Cytophagaceae bacterium SJW1-29]
MATSGTITITQPDAITVQISGNTSVQFGYTNGSNCTTLTASATGGTGSFTYAWRQGNSSIGSKANQQVCPTQTTTYTVTATDAAGCSVQKQITVTVDDVRCGYGGVKVCLGGREQCIAQYLVPTYLRLGYTLGGCNSNTPARMGYEETLTAKPLALSLKAYPNPTSGYVTVEVQSPVAELVKFEVVNAQGRVVKQHQRELVEGFNEVRFELTAQPTGNYLIRAIDVLGHQAVVRVNKQ